MGCCVVNGQRDRSGSGRCQYRHLEGVWLEGIGTTAFRVERGASLEAAIGVRAHGHARLAEITGGDLVISDSRLTSGRARGVTEPGSAAS